MKRLKTYPRNVIVEKMIISQQIKDLDLKLNVPHGIFKLSRLWALQDKLYGASKLASTYFTFFYRSVHVLYTGIRSLAVIGVTSEMYGFILTPLTIG